MQKIISFFLVLLSMPVMAEVYNCESYGQDYLLALTEDSGIVFTNNEGYFKEIKADVKVARSMDGGPLHVNVHPKKGKVDFSRSCFAFLAPNMNFTIHHESVLQLYPNMVLDPKVPSCSYPRVMIAPPQKINCKLME